MTSIQKIGAIIIAGLVIGLFVLVVMKQQSFGGVYNQVQQNFEQGGLKVGPSGTILSQLIKGTCELIGTNVTQTGSSTLPYDCAVTGVVSGDNVMAQISTSTAFKTLNGWSLTGSKASSTSGYITVLLSNHTGASANPSATGVGSTTSYLIIR